jgi:hypothetical protein
MKVEAKLVILYPNDPITPFNPVGHYLKIKVLWSDRIQTLLNSGLYEYLDMCTKIGDDQKKQYVYFGIFPESNLNSKKVPTIKYIRDLERKISLDACCTSPMKENDLKDLSRNYIIRLYDIIVDLDILIDNSEQIIEKRSLQSTEGDIMERAELRKNMIRCSLVVTWYYGFYLVERMGFLKLTVLGSKEVSSLISSDSFWSKNFYGEYSNLSDLSPCTYYFSITGVDCFVGDNKIPTKKMVSELMKTASIGTFIFDEEKFIELFSGRSDYNVEEISTVVDLGILGETVPRDDRFKFIHDLIRSAKDINKKI